MAEDLVRPSTWSCHVPLGRPNIPLDPPPCATTARHVPGGRHRSGAGHRAGRTGSGRSPRRAAGRRRSVGRPAPAGGPGDHAGSARLLRRGGERGRHLLGDARQRVRQPRRTRADFLLRIYLVRPRWERRRRYRQPSRSSATSPCPTRPPDQLPDRAGRQPAAAADRRPTSTSSRCSGCRTAPSGSVRSSARSCCTSTPGPGAVRPCRPPGKSPQNPLLGEATPRRGQRRFRGHGDVAQRTLTSTRSWRRLWSATDDGRRRVISEFDTRQGRYTGRTLGLPGRHRRQPGRRRADDRSHGRCSSSSATTSTARPRSPNGSTGSTSTAPTAPARWPRHWSSTCSSSTTPARSATAAAGEPGDPFSFGLRSVETLVPLPDGRPPDRQRQQLSRQRGPTAGHAGRHRDDHHRPRRHRHGDRVRATPSSPTVAPAATAPSTPWRPTRWRSGSAPTSSSPTSC